MDLKTEVLALLDHIEHRGWNWDPRRENVVDACPTCDGVPAHCWDHLFEDQQRRFHRGHNDGCPLVILRNKLAEEGL